MTNRERIIKILNYESTDLMPVVSFGYWVETLQKWQAEGHVTNDEAESYAQFEDNSPADVSIMKKLGFDFNWNSCFVSATSLYPGFDWETLEQKENGQQIVRNQDGLIVSIKPGTVSIPSEIGTSLEDRSAWEKLYLPKLQYSDARIDFAKLQSIPEPSEREIPIGLHCGSLMGKIRDLLGVEHLSYLYADDEELFVEIIDTFGRLSFDVTKAILETGIKFDYAHFWEDICFKNGPLVNPGLFEERVGPHYRIITDLLKSYGITTVSVDCDGMIDSLIPTWLNNGVNTMFPIEVGTWNASILPWREKYGNIIKGVGGMNKTVFAKDFAAIDIEIERLKPLVDLGGYIPCPDHRIAPDAKWENVQYYCEKFRKAFS